jgi:hypothetical protein
VQECCLRAGLSPLQARAVACRAQGWSVNRIAEEQLLSRRQVATALETAQKKLGRLLETAEREAREFPRRLLFCVQDCRTYDDREPGVSGVTPAPASKRFQGMPCIGADDPLLAQDLPAALRLGELALAAGG